MLMNRTINEKTDEEDLPPVTSGVELAKRLGCELDEGVVVALLPDEIDEVLTYEIPYIDKKGERCHAVTTKCGPWGVRLLDVQSPNDQKFKWWNVKEIAAVEKVQLVPVRWQGPIGEIPARYLERGGVVGIRFNDHGPWFFPKEKPAVESEDAEVKTMVDAVAAVRDSLVAGA